MDHFQGLAFTLEERQVLGIHGLQPARFKTQEEQLELCKISINRYQEDLNKYLYLVDLQVKLSFLRVFSSKKKKSISSPPKTKGSQRTSLFQIIVGKCRNDDADRVYTDCRFGLPEIRFDLSPS